MESAPPLHPQPSPGLIGLPSEDQLEREGLLPWLLFQDCPIGTEPCFLDMGAKAYALGHSGVQLS